MARRNWTGWELLSTVSSDSRPAEYKIRRRLADGVLHCECMAYVFSKASPKSCKHLEAYALVAVDDRRMQRTIAASRSDRQRRERAAGTTERFQLGAEVFTVRRAISFEDI